MLQRESAGDGLVRLSLQAPTVVERALPGQFVMLNLPGSTHEDLVLPRPMAIHRRHPGQGRFDVIIKERGVGSARLAAVREGEQLAVVGPLGTPFSIPTDCSRILLLGRGVGVCSVMTVAEEAVSRGLTVTAALSARHARSQLGIDDCTELGIPFLTFCDEDGSSDTEAVGTTLGWLMAEQPPQLIVTCGSKRLTALAHRLGTAWKADVQVSVETHMACGLGYCHGCTSDEVPGEDGEPPLVCRDGPVFSVVGR